MRHPSPVTIGLVVCISLGLAQAGAAQPAAPSAAHRVTSQPDAGAAKTPGTAVPARGAAAAPGDVSRNLIEDGVLFNTAVGADALIANTTGTNNTASGYRALFTNSTGTANTASGSYTLFSNADGNANTGYGDSALYSNVSGIANTAAGASALYWNTGSGNTASGGGALYFNTSGIHNTAHGLQALELNDTGNANTAVGFNAGHEAITGSYNIYLGAEVVGTAADTNTIRIGLPYDSGSGVGQNNTFIAGIYGKVLTGTAAQVFVDANGQLGTGTPVALLSSSGGTLVTPAAIEQQLQEQRAVNDELRARLARLEARLEALTASGARRR